VSEMVGSDLPPNFTLLVSQKGGWWKVTSPEHPGLVLAHPDLQRILADVPLSLSTLLRMDREAALEPPT
jgi:hypothetical protein